MPYTYYAFIKAPAYEWMPWFAKYHALLYWVALALVAIAHRQSRLRFSRWPVFAALATAGAYVAARPFLVLLHDDWAAYGLTLVKSAANS